MKKTLQIISIVLIIGYISFFIFNKFDTSKVYTNTSTANEPNLKHNSKMIVSNLVTPKTGDFIAYNSGDTLVRVHRLCAVENDIIKIVNGLVYVNDKNIDAKIALMHTYLIPKEAYFKIKKAAEIADYNIGFEVDSVTIQILLEDKVATKYGFTSNRKIESKNTKERMITNRYGHDWNKDNFGPVQIPKNKVFVIGDNRDNSEDSRYLGFVDNNNILGTVVTK